MNCNGRLPKHIWILKGNKCKCNKTNMNHFHLTMKIPCYSTYWKGLFFSFFLNLWRKRSTSQGKPKVLIILTRKFPAEKILISNPFSTMTKFLGILESLSKIATWIKCLGFYVAKKRLDYTTGNLQCSTQFYLVYPGKAANNLSLLKGHIPG